MSTLIALLIIAGIVLLQIFLSKRESKWPGLVMPIIAFLFSFLYPFNMVALFNDVAVELVAKMILAWILGNIPTIILLAIYFGCRGKQRRNKQLEKMNIQDLA